MRPSWLRILPAYSPSRGHAPVMGIREEARRVKSSAPNDQQHSSYTGPESPDISSHFPNELAYLHNNVQRTLGRGVQGDRP